MKNKQHTPLALGFATIGMFVLFTMVFAVSAQSVFAEETPSNTSDILPVISRTDSLHVQGASFLYGSIVNPQGDVTIADRLRVEGAIYRSSGPVVIGDDLNVHGSLIRSFGPVRIADDLDIHGAISRAFGPVKIQDGLLQLGGENVSFSGAVSANNGLTVAGALSLPEGSITSSMLSQDIDLGSGGTGLTADSVTSSHIVDGTIVSADLKDGSVTTAKLTDESITTAKLTDESVTTSKIANGTITNDDISSASAISASKISGVLLSAPSSSQTIVYGMAGAQTILQMAADPTASPFLITDFSGTSVFALTSAGLISTASVNSDSIVDASIASDDLASNAITSSKILDSTIANADISSSAAIALSKLASGSSGQIVVANSSGVPSYVALSGDATISNAGALTIATGAVENGMLASDAVTSAKILDSTIAEADLAAGAAAAGGITVYNNTVLTLTAGQLVTIDSFATTNGLTVLPAENNSAVSENGATHVVETAIPNSTLGTVYAYKVVGGFDTSAQTIGDAVYLGSSGGVTYSDPNAGGIDQIVGVVKTVHASTGEIYFFPGAHIIEGIGGSLINPNALDVNHILTNLMLNTGAVESGYVDITGATSDTETVTFDMWTFEFDTDVVPNVTPGRIAVDVSGGASATQSATALTTVINNGAYAEARDVGDGTILLSAPSIGANGRALSETMANGNVSGAAMTGGMDVSSDLNIIMTSHTVTNQDVTTTNAANGTIVVAGITSASAPSMWMVQVRDSNGTIKAMTNSQFSWQTANNYVLLQLKDTVLGNDLAANDTITTWATYE